MSTTIIVVFGNKHHGKDTLANMLAIELRRRHPDAPSDRASASVHRDAFGFGVKMAGEYMIGIPHDLPEAEKETRLFYGKTARQWWQWLGTEIARNQVHNDVWIDRLLDRVEASAARYAIISDGRYRNEMLALSAKGAERRMRLLTVKVYRPDEPVDLSHSSESEVHGMPRDMFDAWVLNDGEKSLLASRADMLASRIIAGW